MKITAPAPEVANLAYFIGQWTVEGAIFPGPWGAGGKFGWADTTEWMAGKFFAVGHWKFTMPAELGGDGEELFIMGYDSQQRIYTFDAFSSHGLHQVSKGRLNGDTWIWDSEGVQGGGLARQKMTMRMLSPTRYTLKFEISNDGGKWVTFMEGTAAKK
jgi:Protein of unknown function (DUF1579)